MKYLWQAPCRHMHMHVVCPELITMRCSWEKKLWINCKERQERVRTSRMHVNDWTTPTYYSHTKHMQFPLTGTEILLRSACANINTPKLPRGGVQLFAHALVFLAHMAGVTRKRRLNHSVTRPDSALLPIWQQMSRCTGTWLH